MSANYPSFNAPAVSRALTKSYYSVEHFILLVYPAVLRCALATQVSGLIHHSCDYSCLAIAFVESVSDPRVLSIAALIGGFALLVVLLVFKPHASSDGALQTQYRCRSHRAQSCTRATLC